MEMTDLEDVAHRYKAATTALEAVRTEMQTTAITLLQRPDIKQADVARVTGWSREHLRRLKEKAEVEALRRKVKELTAPAEPPAYPQKPTSKKAAPAKRKPEPTVEGRPLLEDEAQKFAALARSRATTLQNQGLDQATGPVGDGIKDYVVVSEALSMGLLTHDEVYGPAGSEETTT